jgi:hypothetical protein
MLTEPAPHAHDWRPTDEQDYRCALCEETTSPCNTCGLPVGSSLAICSRCLDRAHQLLDDLRAYIREIPDGVRTVAGVRAIRYDLGSAGGQDDDGRLPHSLDALYVEDVPVCGPSSIRSSYGAMDLLESWVDDWAEKSGDAVGARDTIGYLRAHTLWAAQNSEGWLVYLDELRATRAVVRRIAGLAPEPVGVCPSCGGNVVRDWRLPLGERWERGRLRRGSRLEGLDDVARCNRCGRRWTGREHLVLEQTARLLELADTDPDVWVTLEQARRLVPTVRRNTINQVLVRDRRRPVERQRLPVRGHDDAGVELYRLGDVRALEATATPVPTSADVGA